MQHPNPSAPLAPEPRFEDKNLQMRYEGLCLFHSAHTKAELALFLLQHPQWLHWRNTIGYSGLHMAVTADNFDAVTTLVEHGMDVTLRDAHNKMAVDYATLPHRAAIKDYLYQQHLYQLQKEFGKGCALPAPQPNVLIRLPRPKGK